MATSVKSTKTAPRKSTQLGGGPGVPGPNGKGPKGNGWKGGQEPRRRLSPSAYRITMWIILASIVMMFAALSSIYIALSFGGNQGQAVRMPRIFFISTGVILASSVTLENAKRSLQLGKQLRTLQWLSATLLLGLVFLVFQLFGWRELSNQGVYFAARPNSSFFYLFTGVHGLHLLGGIAGLLYLLYRTKRTAISEQTDIAAQMVSLYWHVMDGLWLWLFLLLLIWK